MSQKVRVRFAPSPTGPLHIGGVRTALYNYLFAKKHKGDFLLRIEDTDQARYVANAEQYIINSLNWAGIPYDEGLGKEGKHAPYRQSERKELYKIYIQQLIESGWAYYAFDSNEKLDQMRKQLESEGKTFSYGLENREQLENSIALNEQIVQEKLNSNEPYVIRFKIPKNETLLLTDIIRGEMKIDTNTLDDKVLFKSDGMPTYHLANIVDDHLMEITHVIRGEEWLPSLALHHLLYKAFGWDAPQFAHLPLLLKPEGQGKLSKRDGDKFGFPVFPMEFKDEKTGEISRGYREDGYFPEAFINMLALLGWHSDKDQELFSLEELINEFSLERVSKSGAKFDVDKTKWFQQQYLQKKSDEELNELFKEYLKKNAILIPNSIPDNEGFTLRLVQLLRERAIFVSDFYQQGKYFFETPKIYDENAVKKVWQTESSKIISELRDFLSSLDYFDALFIETKIKEWITEKGLGMGKVFQPFRLALVGNMSGPHVFDIAAVIGKEETLSRLDLIQKKYS
jgi:glutamyl-tRNA synthetase